MNKLELGLKKEVENLEKIIEKLTVELQHFPPGKLRISKGKSKTSYYHITEETPQTRGKYIRKTDQDLIQQLAQKAYDKKTLRRAEYLLPKVRCLAAEYEKMNIESIYRHESAERQQLIQPAVPLWNQVLEKWMKEKYNGNIFADGTPELFTEQGERVRSKSEKILADFFHHKDIPYKYEKPLYLEGRGTIYPDFTFLSPKTFQEIYWEHLGMMDDPGYCENAILKILTYEKNGIFPGERLILTYETSHRPLGTKEIELLVQHYLL